MPHFVHLSNRQIQYLYQPSWPYAKKEAWYVLFFSWVNAYLQSAVILLETQENKGSSNRLP